MKKAEPWLASDPAKIEEMFWDLNSSQNGLFKQGLAMVRSSPYWFNVEGVESVPPVTLI